MTAPVPLSCPKCRAGLTGELAPPGAPGECPSCRRPIEGFIFPAHYRPPVTGQAAESVVTAEDAGCFYHPKNRALVPCDLCGRFLCALCDVELHGQHLCPACVDAGRRKNRLRELDGDRMLYGRVALVTAILPLFVWPLTFMTGPAAVFIAIYGWNKPPSLTGTRHLSHVAAIVLGLAEISGWVLLLTGLFHVS